MQDNNQLQTAGFLFQEPTWKSPDLQSRRTPVHDMGIYNLLKDCPLVEAHLSISEPTPDKVITTYFPEAFPEVTAETIEKVKRYGLDQPTLVIDAYAVIANGDLFKAGLSIPLFDLKSTRWDYTLGYFGANFTVFIPADKIMLNTIGMMAPGNPVLAELTTWFLNTLAQAREVNSHWLHKSSLT